MRALLVVFALRAPVAPPLPPLTPPLALLQPPQVAQPAQPASPIARIIVFRSQPHGSYKLFFNGLYLSVAK